MGCTECHGGVDALSSANVDSMLVLMDNSHEGMVVDPAANAEESCGRCHGDIVALNATSLHTSFRGYETLFEARTGLSFAENHEVAEEFKNECGVCHTTCGQCHISYPNSVKGGLVRSHKFLGRPSQSAHCTSCHGSRVGEEYLGSREGYSADVHYVPNSMNCVSCHDQTEMHGDGTEYETRYHSEAMPRCEDCHGGVAEDTPETNAWHAKHSDNFACQVCHSQDYKNCNLCHVAGTGIREPSYIDFKIGKNPLPELREEYDYVVLRHIPIANDTYSPWGVAEQDNFEALPTWKYASPHNIKRWTARTDTTGGVSCGYACHTTPDEGGWFLRQSDLDIMTDPDEQTANQEFIVPNGSPVNW